MTEGDEFRSILRILIALLGIGALIVLALVLSGGDAKLNGRVVVTAVFLAFYSLIAAAGTRHAARGREILTSPFGYLTILLALIAFGEAVAAYWHWSATAVSGTWRPAADAGLAAFCAGNVSLLLGGEQIDDPPSIRAVQTLAVVGVIALTLLALIEIATPGPDVDRRLMGVSATIYVFGTIALPLLRRLGPAV